MFSTEDWLLPPYDRQNARSLYDDILYPQQWEMGWTEAEALALARSRWQPAETYWLYQPIAQSALW